MKDIGYCRRENPHRVDRSR